MKKVKTAVALGAFIILGMGAKVEADTVSQSGVNRVHFINTKGSPGTDAILLESNGHYALIDMGEDYDFPDGSNPLYPLRFGTTTSNFYAIEDRLFRHLDQLGVKKLDFILGTHVHSDHIGGADEVLQRYKVDKFYLKRYSDDRISSQWGLWDNLFNYNNALNAAKKYGVNVVQDISEKDSHFKFGDMDIQLYNYKNEYGPDGKLKKVYDDNPNSIVSVITVNGKKIYLGGDLDNVYGAEDRLGPKIGKVDLMKWNHHLDGKVSNSINFLNNLSPSIVVQTTGLDINVQATRDKLKQMNVQLVHASSDRKDATVFDITKDGINNISQEFPDIQSTSARWVTEDGFKKYYFGDGQMATGWHTFDGNRYFFNGKGQLQQNKWIQDFDAEGNLKSLYMDKEGRLRTSEWLLLDGHWYYVNTKGYRMEAELAIINGKTYYFDEKGVMQTGTRTVNGTALFFDNTGALSNEGKPLSWNKIGNKWYYLDLKDGVMVTGVKEIDGQKYSFKDSGAMETGWKQTDGKWYYYAASGEMKRGWIKDTGKWYFLNYKDGAMVTGRQEIDGIQYSFNGSGAMETGWVYDGKDWYYHRASGAIEIGWFKYTGKWFFLDHETGKMVTGIHEVSGENYYFNNAGEMKTGWIQEKGEWYYFKASGAMLRNGTTPDGYKVDGEGRWLPNGVTTTTTTTSTTETTTAEETTQEQTTQETTVEPKAGIATTSEDKSIPASGDKAS